jgi:phospholipase C
VARGVYDHTSVLKLIEWRWDLAPLTVRDATANNLAEVLNFARADLAAPGFAVPPSLAGPPCPPGALLPGGMPMPRGEEEDEWTGLRLAARGDGWPV